VMVDTSANDLIEALLRRVVDDEWSGRYNRACHCHPEYARCCPECRIPEKEGPTEHEPGCERKAIIDKASAYLRAENELAEKRGEDV